MSNLRKKSFLKSSLQGHIYYFGKRARARFYGKLISRRLMNALFLDIDGTIWPDNGHGSLLKEFVLDSNTKRSILEMRKHFDFVVLVTNQTHFARMSSIKSKDLELYFQNISSLQEQLKFDLLLACHHHINAQNVALQSACNFRKPGIEMFLNSRDILGLELRNCVTIGDRLTDIISSTDAGILNNFLLANNRAHEMNEGEKAFRNEGYVFRLCSSLEDIIDLLNLKSHA